MTLQDFITLVVKARRTNKNTWHCFSETVEGKHVELKFFDKHNQILRVDGVRHGGLYHRTVGDWKHEIFTAITY